MFLENVGGTFPWQHLVVSSAGPTPSTVTPEQELAEDCRGAPMDVYLLITEPGALLLAVVGLQAPGCSLSPQGQQELSLTLGLPIQDSQLPTHPAVGEVHFLGTLC